MGHFFDREVEGGESRDNFAIYGTIKIQSYNN